MSPKLMEGVTGICAKGGNGEWTSSNVLAKAVIFLSAGLGTVQIRVEAA